MQTSKFPIDTQSKMMKLLEEVKTSSETKRVQCVLLGSRGISSVLIAPIVGWAPEYVRKVWNRYRKEGEKYILGEKRGINRNRAHISFEKEKEFLKPIFKQAEKGGILIVSDIKKEYEKYIGRQIHNSIIYKVLHRHGWRKIVPRPLHPKANQSKQKEFKEVIFPHRTFKSK